MILHGGKVVYEAYPGLQPSRPHIWASVSKTTVGLMVSILEEDGLIDVNKPVAAYAKQLAGSEWDKVPVIDALNMAGGVEIPFPQQGLHLRSISPEARAELTGTGPRPAG